MIFQAFVEPFLGWRGVRLVEVDKQFSHAQHVGLQGMLLCYYNLAKVWKEVWYYVNWTPRL